MNEIVKYHNDLNASSIRTWTETEMNIFFSVVAKVKAKSTTKIEITFDELRNLSRYRDNSKAGTTLEFVEELTKVNIKLAGFNYVERSDNGLKTRVVSLFKEFYTDGEARILYVQVHDDFEHIFNRFGVNFTSFELLEFVNISSTYAKTAYRQLKQFRTQGWWHVTAEDFRKLLSIPETYKSGNVDQKVLKPILAQLGGSDETAIFRNLKVEKIKKAGRGRGGVLTGYKFTFDKEKTGAYTADKYALPDKPADNPGTPATPAPYKKRKPKSEVVPEWVSNPNADETELTPEDAEMLNGRIASVQKYRNKRA